MKNIKYLLILLMGIFAGCEDVVEVDLDTAAPRLVIDASIDWVKGTDGSTQEIRLTTTTGFYETEVPVVTGAAVTVTNSDDIIFEFVETPGTGVYVCNNFVPELGETYELTVETGGQVYTAVETLIAAPEIDNVSQDDEGGFTGDVIEIKFFFQDDATQDNFYMTGFETNITVFPDYDVFDDEFSQGNQNFGFYMNEDLESGDEMIFSLYGISERYMNYMDILLDISEGDGGPWQTTPTNVRGNIINQTNSKNFALGYFRLSEVDKMEYTVQ
ncbi:MAG TPA: DUF4249 domain-containing protein [Flavobacterium sp.]|jgi:hypothetical protein